LGWVDPKPNKVNRAIKKQVRFILPTDNTFATLSDDSEIVWQSFSLSMIKAQTEWKTNKGKHRKSPRKSEMEQPRTTPCAPYPLDKDRNDRMLLSSEFKALETECGKFDIDLCCDNQGKNSHCRKFCSPSNPAQEARMAGRNVFCNGPFLDQNQYVGILEQYLREKAKKPFTTSGCFVVPDWHSAPWWKQLDGMNLIRYYPRGTVLFSSPMSDGTRRVMPPIRWPVCVFWDPPIPRLNNLSTEEDDDSDDGDVFDTHATDDDQVNPNGSGMSLLGTIHGKECNVFIDSGAEGQQANFIRKSFVDQLQVDVVESKTKVTFGDGRKSSTYGTAALRLHLKAIHGTLRQTMEFTVIDMPDAHDIILGVPFLTLFNPDIDWKRGFITTRNGRKKFTFKPLFNGKESSQRNNNGVHLQRVTATEFERDLFAEDTEAVFCLHIRDKGDDLAARVGKETSASHLPTDIPPQLRKLVEKYKLLFPETIPKGLPKHSFRHKIDLIDGAKPHCRYPYRLSLPELQELENQLRVLLAEGRIRTSSSPWGAPILFARKKDGGLRMCVDYRALNKLTIKNKYPLPRTEDCLDKLSRASCFTSLDLAQGFWQIPMEEADISKTAFVSPLGQFEWTVMPFGLCNAPSTFQAAMDHVLRDFIGKFVVVYIDDILIFSDNDEDHLKHLDLVFKRLQDFNLFCKPHKCSFGKKETKFLGFIVGNRSQRLDPSVFRVVEQWKPPTDTSGIRSFMGFLNHYRRFIPKLSSLAAPLSKLQSPKVAWEWNKEQQDAFDSLKATVCKAPVLRLFDDSRPIRVYTDASGWATGAVLLQDFGEGWQPIAYDSKKLNSAQQNYSTYDRELLAIFRALTHWRCYLLGRRFEVMTDHATLRHMLQQPQLTNPRRIRWISELMEYDFDVLYAPGKDNPSDPLSRLLRLQVHPHYFAIKESFQSMPEITPTLRNKIREAYKADWFFKSDVNRAKFTESDGILFFKDRICIPDDKEIKTAILREYHEAPYSGHQGIKRTMELLLRYYFWPRMKYDVQAYIKECLECQRNKVRNIRASGLLQPLPIPSRRWEHISMDYITHLPTTIDTGYNSVWVIVDRFTKMCHFVPCHHTITAKETAKLFIKEIFRLHGVPKTIVSDRDPIFTSEFWKGLFEYLGTTLCMSSGYHPQTDGQTERMNRTLEEMLRAYCAEEHRQHHWDDYLPLVEFQYNNAVNRSTGFSPFFLAYGQHPITPAALLASEPTSTLSIAEDAAEFVASLQELSQAAVASMERAQENAKRYYDLKRKEPTFAVGDLVFVEGIALPDNRRGTKIGHLRHGPFKIIQQINPVAFKLDTPATWKVHNVFHSSFLTAHNPHRDLEPDKVLEARVFRSKKQLLIRYKGHTHHQDAWVDEQDFKGKHPRLYLDFIRRMAASAALGVF
jgi:hypothetical protein